MVFVFYFLFYFILFHLFHFFFPFLISKFLHMNLHEGFYGDEGIKHEYICAFLFAAFQAGGP